MLGIYQQQEQQADAELEKVVEPEDFVNRVRILCMLRESSEARWPTC